MYTVWAMWQTVQNMQHIVSYCFNCGMECRGLLFHTEFHRLFLKWSL